MGNIWRWAPDRRGLHGMQAFKMPWYESQGFFQLVGRRKTELPFAHCERGALSPRYPQYV